MSEQNYIRLLKFHNAFGIKSLKVNLPGSNHILKNCSIYASNGVFKTSFSRTLDFLAKGNIDSIEDRLTGVKFSYDIQVGDESIDNHFSSILVFSKDIYDIINLTDMSNPLTKLTANNEDINRLLNIEKKYKEYKSDFEKTIKSSGYTPDFIYNLFEVQDPDRNISSFIEFLIKLSKSDVIPGVDKLKSKTLTSKVGDALDKSDIQKKFKSYSDYINKKLSSIFFDDKFNDNTVFGFVKSLESTNFINAEKKRFIVVNDVPYHSLESFKTVVDNKLKEIIDDPQIKEMITEFEKDLGTSQPANDIKIQIREDTEIAKLYSLGRKPLVLASIKQFLTSEIDNDIQMLVQLRDEIDKVIAASESRITNFESALKIFRNRFNSIFTVSIKDKGLTVLGMRAPTLIFTHDSEPSIDVEESKLSSILSSGEKTTLNIIKFIVEYELIKNKNPIIILDDIIETFDYANRYAFMQYINDMIKDKANVILLSHNYEFYRSSIKRCNLSPLVATLNRSNKTVYITKNKKLLFNPYISSEAQSMDRLIFAVPFAREISILTGKPENLFLPYLHYKQETSQKLMSDLYLAVNSIFANAIIENVSAENYFIKLITLCNSYSQAEFDSFDIEAKIVLSIGIRLLLEKLIIKDDYSKIEDINENQTVVLIDKYRDIMVNEFVELCDEVCLITPEFIHVNSFMYEPLIDIDPYKLKNLYIKIKELSDNNFNIWIE
ncbi:MAG: hypothetical protein KKH92_01740 [Firmicutes bacterium]|nr:hypothetical protein [Bacillota bacterium]